MPQQPEHLSVKETVTSLIAQSKEDDISLLKEYIEKNNFNINTRSFEGMTKPLGHGFATFYEQLLYTCMYQRRLDLLQELIKLSDMSICLNGFMTHRAEGTLLIGLDMVLESVWLGQPELTHRISEILRLDLNGSIKNNPSSHVLFKVTFIVYVLCKQGPDFLKYFIDKEIIKLDDCFKRDKSSSQPSVVIEVLRIIISRHNKEDRSHDVDIYDCDRFKVLTSAVSAFGLNYDSEIYNYIFPYPVEKIKLSHALLMSCAIAGNLTLLVKILDNLKISSDSGDPFCRSNFKLKHRLIVTAMLNEHFSMAEALLERFDPQFHQLDFSKDRKKLCFFLFQEAKLFKESVGTLVLNKISKFFGLSEYTDGYHYGSYHAATDLIGDSVKPLPAGPANPRPVSTSGPAQTLTSLRAAAHVRALPAGSANPMPVSTSGPARTLTSLRAAAHARALPPGPANPAAPASLVVPDWWRRVERMRPCSLVGACSRAGYTSTKTPGGSGLI